MVAAEGSWSHFNKKLGFHSAGTWAVSFEEIDAPGGLVFLSAPVDDMSNPALNNPAHCLIDFNGLESKGEKKRRAQQLAIKASARGCQFQPPN